MDLRGGGDQAGVLAGERQGVAVGGGQRAVAPDHAALGQPELRLGRAAGEQREG